MKAAPDSSVTALVNGRIVLPHATLSDMALLIKNGKICRISRQNEIGLETEQVDVGGRIISPGLVDIHNHGALGFSFNEPTGESYGAITNANVQSGVTSIVATLATAPISEMTECLGFCRKWMSEPSGGSRVLGVHVEGPYFSAAQCGAQDPKNLRTPDDGTPDILLNYSDIIKIFSFAPELPGAVDLTSRLVAHKIIPAAGHSSASEADLVSCINAGLAHTIHIWSGQSTTTRDGPWRNPGLLDVSLVYEDLTAELIADRKHVPDTLMKLAHRCIGSDRLCLISDATSGAGLPDGSQFTMGNMTYIVSDGVGMMTDHSCFAGSTTLLNRMVANVIEVLEIPLHEAIRMASYNPARMLGLEQHLGSLKIGGNADISIFDDDFRVWRSMIGGSWVDEAKNSSMNDRQIKEQDDEL